MPFAAALKIQYHCLALFLVTLLAGCVSPQVKLDIADIAEASMPAARDKTVAIIGATGMTGRYILRAALAEGYPVKVLARTPSKLQDLGARIDIVKGDARDPDAITQLLAGSDIVITALGPVKADGAASQMISTVATGHVINAMQQSQHQRYLVVSGAAVVVPGDDRNIKGWWMRQLVKLRLRSVLADKQSEYELLAASDIDWTLIRCPLIDSLPYQNAPLVSLLSPSSFHLKAGELADFILRETQDPAFIRQAPFLYSE